jgi:DNA repair exonuclease SbcCD ATPase subunit
MAQRLRAIIADEQTTFVREYQAELPKLQTLADRLKAVEGKLTERQELVQKHTALRNARQAEAEDLQKKLDAERQAVAEETTKLAAVQQQLFALQQDFAKAQATNQRLEGELRGKETEK